MSHDPRRRHPRRAVPGIVNVFDTIIEENIGHLGNISAGGMLLIANRNLPADALFQFRFWLPDDLGASQTIEAGAHLLWIDAASTPGQHWAGLRFLGLSPTAIRRLHLWTEHPEAR